LVFWVFVKRTKCSKKIEIFLGLSNFKIKRTTMYAKKLTWKYKMQKRRKCTYSLKLGVKLVARIVGS
jgi:hypothetical protein